MELSKLMKIRRGELNITQKELAELSGLSLNSIRWYEQGQQHPSLPSLRKLEIALKLEKGTLTDNDL
jgi:transcriptional regulator with XRE-family HTH domain